MSTCTCSCVDGYRIRRASCTVHGEQDAQVIAGHTVTIPAGQLSREHIGWLVQWGVQLAPQELTYVGQSAHSTTIGLPASRTIVDPFTPVTVWPAGGE